MMKSYFLIIILVLVISCKSETTNNPLSTGNSMIDSTLLRSQNQIDTATQSAASTEPDKKIDPEIKVKERMHDSEYVEKIKAQVNNSKFKEKSCEQILIEYKELANQVIASKNPGLFREKGWNKNDPIFQACLQGNDKFKKEYFELNDKMIEVLK